jgi:hypothetical protein
MSRKERIIYGISVFLGLALSIYAVLKTII